MLPASADSDQAAHMHRRSSVHASPTCHNIAFYLDRLGHVDRVSYNKNLSWGIDRSVPRVTALHHEACRVILDCDPEGHFFFYLPLTPIKDSFCCIPFIFFSVCLC